MQKQILMNENENLFFSNFINKLEIFNNKIDNAFKLIDDYFFFDGLLKKEINLNFNNKIRGEFIELKEWKKNNFLRKDFKEWIKKSIINLNNYFDLIEIKIREILELIGKKIGSLNYLDKAYPYRKNSKLWRYDLISTEVFSTLNDYDFYTKIHSEELNYYLQELKLLKNDLNYLIEKDDMLNILKDQEIKLKIYNLIFNK